MSVSEASNGVVQEATGNGATQTPITTTQGLAIGLGIAGSLLLTGAVIASLYVWRKRRSKYLHNRGRYSQIERLFPKSKRTFMEEGVMPSSISYDHYNYINRGSLMSTAESGYASLKSDHRDVEYRGLDNSYDAITRGFNRQSVAETASTQLTHPKQSLQLSPVFVFSPPSPTASALAPPVPRKSSRRDSGRFSTDSSPLPGPGVPRKSSRRGSAPGARPYPPPPSTVPGVTLLRPRSASFASSVYSVPVSNNLQTPYSAEQYQYSKESVAFTHLDLQTLNSITPMPEPDVEAVDSPHLEYFPSPPLSGRTSPFNLLLRMGTRASTRTSSGISNISPIISPMSTPETGMFRPSTPPTPPCEDFSEFAHLAIRCDSGMHIDVDDEEEVETEHDTFINANEMSPKPLRFKSLKEESKSLVARPELVRAYSEL